MNKLEQKTPIKALTVYISDTEKLKITIDLHT